MLYEVMCIATAIYFEARGEPLAGRFAVAEVVINRMHDPRYPDDACSVVYDGGETPSETDCAGRQCITHRQQGALLGVLLRDAGAL